ncbi:hypothetical protein [Rathayibacter iranicus]|uniref:Uncharacterized protein n=1 Tax=Rathayibacter iranicus NCPPB 2253 = VKM Ac-1602 TaxID=1328868 RepID=A0ABX5LD15_9MICO|nr:hypothetical protein [Rathayibacter iranicus]MWV30778.1 hypothetical protein [Rathayibacter iranicus NCPPB 2253 = VKM Ac-1602]PWJ64686.1 hypothetical protein B0H03_10452 [Rathayibacter iranicus NCPPB 2253 = VKM Ac-1602]
MNSSLLKANNCWKFPPAPLSVLSVGVTSEVPSINRKTGALEERSLLALRHTIGETIHDDVRAAAALFEDDASAVAG